MFARWLRVGGEAGPATEQAPPTARSPQAAPEPDRKTADEAVARAWHNEAAVDAAPVPLPPPVATPSDLDAAHQADAPGSGAPHVAPPRLTPAWPVDDDAAPTPIAADPRRHAPEASTPQTLGVEAALQSAQAAWEAGDPATAISTLDAAIERHPEEPELARVLARAYAEAGRWTSASERWRHLLHLAPADLEAHAGLAAALQAQGDTAAAEAALATSTAVIPEDLGLGITYARMAEERGDWPEAAERWRRLAAAAPDAPHGGYGHAGALQRLGYRAQAEAVLADLVAQFPDHASALHDLARLAEQRGDWGLAERCWQDFNVVDTSHWWSYSALAAAVLRQGRRKESEAILHEALARFPDQPSLFADQARVAEARGDWPEAIRRWDDVIARFPASWTGYGGKVAALAGTGRQIEADTALLRYAALLPDDLEALHDRARHAERHQDWTAAEVSWRRFVQQEPRVDWAHRGLVEALLRQDRLAEADAALQAAMQRLPGTPSFAIDAARLAERRDQPVVAAAHWRDVARLLPASPAGAIGESHVLATQGDIAGANAVIEAALARLPDEPTLYEAHADLAIAAGDARQALNRLQEGHRRCPGHAGLAQRIDDIAARLEGASAGP